MSWSDVAGENRTSPPWSMSKRPVQVARQIGEDTTRALYRAIPNEVKLYLIHSRQNKKKVHKIME